MELAIPLIGLGALFVVNSQTKKKKETFESMGKKGNYLPNIDNLPQNYPVVNIPELVDTVQEYPNPNQATDKYFNQSYFEKKNDEGKTTGSNIQNVYSLTGNYLQNEEFKHNNMVPFYGGKMYGGDFKNDMAQNTLDQMTGAGSQMIHKTEQAPLFKPEDNVQWAFGTPDMNDFYQSRVNPGTMNKNSVPFVSENVGPGLNRGYTSEGSNGFNSGLEARELWQDKTVDQLRIATNPKESFSLLSHEGPAESHITNLGKIGTVEKNRPDTFYINTQDRWLTTTGLEKGNRLNPIELLKEEHRATTTKEYIGNASHKNKAIYAPRNMEPSKRNELESFDKYPTHSYAGNIGYNENNLKNTLIEKNNRSTNCQPISLGSSFNRSIGAVVMPFMDMFKPTKKEEFSCNLRTYGNPQSNVPQLNPFTQEIPSTIKEGTLYTPHSFVGQQVGGGYMTNNQTPTGTQRTTTGSTSYMGPVGGDALMYGNAVYNTCQINNDTKEKLTYTRTNHGNTQIFNQSMNVSIHKDDKNKTDCYSGTPYTVFGAPPSKEYMGAIDLPPEKNHCMEDRIQPDLLNAFRENPYTHSLTYAV
jgi:hypothetical protein